MIWHLPCHDFLDNQKVGDSLLVIRSGGTGTLIRELGTGSPPINALLVLKTAIPSIAQDGFSLLILEDECAVKRLLEYTNISLVCSLLILFLRLQRWSPVQAIPGCSDLIPEPSFLHLDCICSIISAAKRIGGSWSNFREQYTSCASIFVLLASLILATLNIILCRIHSSHETFLSLWHWRTLTRRYSYGAFRMRFVQPRTDSLTFICPLHLVFLVSDVYCNGQSAQYTDVVL